MTGSRGTGAIKARRVLEFTKLLQTQLILLKFQLLFTLNKQHGQGTSYRSVSE
jgi:hypothetical protein